MRKGIKAIIDVVVELCKEIDGIKLASHRMEYYPLWCKEKEREIEFFLLTMPVVPRVDISNAKSLEELLLIVKNYSSLYKEDSDKLAKLDDYNYQKSYDEFPLREAEEFVNKMTDLINDLNFICGMYSVLVYDLNDTCVFELDDIDECKEIAERLAPASIYHNDEHILSI